MSVVVKHFIMGAVDHSGAEQINKPQMTTLIYYREALLNLSDFEEIHRERLITRKPVFCSLQLQKSNNE